MFYENRKEKLKIDLSHLNREEAQFYREALSRFRKNVSWLEFEEFAFGKDSAIYRDRQSHVELRSDALFRALRDMWSELGVRQGAMSRATEEERRQFAKRREESRRRKAEKRQDSPAERHVATAH